MKKELHNLKKELYELHLLGNEATAIDWQLIKDIICGMASVLESICSIIPLMSEYKKDEHEE